MWRGAWYADGAAGTFAGPVSGPREGRRSGRADTARSRVDTRVPGRPTRPRRGSGLGPARDLRSRAVRLPHGRRAGPRLPVKIFTDCPRTPLSRGLSHRPSGRGSQETDDLGEGKIEAFSQGPRITSYPADTGSCSFLPPPWRPCAAPCPEWGSADLPPRGRLRPPPSLNFDLKIGQLYPPTQRRSCVRSLVPTLRQTDAH